MRLKAIVVVESLEEGNLHRGFRDGFLQAGIDTVTVMGPRSSGKPAPFVDNQILNEVRRFKPQVLAVIKGGQIRPETILNVGKMGVKTVNWQIDDPFEQKPQRNLEALILSKPYQYVFTTDKKSVPPYWKPGGVLPFGVDPVHHRPMGLVRDIEVSFVGSIYPPRATYLQNISSVNVWGNCHPLCVKAGRIPHAEMIRVVNRSIIALNFSDQPDGYLGLKNRLWEILGTRSFCLTEDSYNLRDYFIPGVDLDTFKTVDEFKEKVNFYLKHPDIRERIAAAGHEKVMENWKYANNITAMMGMIGLKL